MSDAPAAITRDISIDAPWSLIEAFATQPREKPQDGNIGAEMIAERLRGFGVPVTVHQPELYLSLPIAASVEAAGARFAAKPPAFSVSAPDGIEAPLVCVPAAGTGNPLDRAGGPLADPERFAGRIVITEGFALPNAVAAYEAVGAAGVIAVNPGDRIHWGTVSTIWGTPDLDDLPRLPKIVSAAVNNADGQALIEIANRGGSARVFTELECGWFPSKIPVVEIPGARRPDQFVLLHGHYDSWDVGVGDNGTGNACMLEIARVLWANRERLDRSVRLAWWAGHSTGRYGGSAWFADTFAQDLVDNCVIQMNCDSPGCRWATSYRSISLTSETEAAVKAVVKAVTGQDTAGKRPQRNSDYAFNNIGISGAFMASSMMPPEALEEHGYYVVGGCGGNIAWHTEDDTLEIADKTVLLKDIELYTSAVLAFANADILPFDWRATTREFAVTLDRYQTAAGDRFDLAPAQEAVAALDGALEDFHAGIEAGSVGADAANDAIRDLARILVPLNYTRLPRFRHDPALNVPPLPALAAAEELDRHGADTVGFATTQLLRGRNRVVAGLREAERRIRRALAPTVTTG